MIAAGFYDWGKWYYGSVTMKKHYRHKAAKKIVVSHPNQEKHSHVGRCFLSDP